MICPAFRPQVIPDKFPDPVRYLKASLLCALAATVVALGLYLAGAFRGPDAWLASLLGEGISASSGRPLSQCAAVLLVSLGTAWVAIDLSRRAMKLLVALGVLAEIIGLTLVLGLYGVYFSPFSSLLALLIACAAGLIYSGTAAGQRKRILRQVFGDRISTATFNALVDSTAPLHFGGELRSATVLVCEIFNHEELMEALATPDFVAATNLLLRRGADFLVERGAYLDECAGRDPARHLRRAPGG